MACRASHLKHCSLPHRKPPHRLIESLQTCVGVWPHTCQCKLSPSSAEIVHFSPV